jgi:hypothetical protein
MYGFLCSDPDANETFKQAMLTLKNWMLDHHTTPPAL